MTLNDIDLTKLDKVPDKFRVVLDSLFCGSEVTLPKFGRVRMANTIDESVSLIMIYDDGNIIGLPDMTLTELYKLSNQVSEKEITIMASNAALNRIKRRKI